MASERIHNEYDATRIANAVDTLAENLAGYTPERPVTPTDAMKAKLPSQSTGDRIADAVESLAQNFNGSNTVVADTEVSPAENTHDIGTYLTYNGKEYVVLKYIDIDDPLDYESGDPNIEEVSLPDGTYIVTDDGDGEGGSGGGHTIIDASGTSMTARSGLKFGEGFNTADDSSNNQTVVTPNVNVIAKQSEISDVILTGDKPSSAITEGKFFVDKNGLLRVATSSIGTTDDVDNTNSTVKSIGEVLGELNSNLINSNNGIFRGKNLGTITASNIAAFVSEHGIATGEFKDIFLGDYFVIQDGTYNVEWIVAGFDCELNRGYNASAQPSGLTKHHICCIPKIKVTDARMNASHTTEGGYLGSEMCTTTLPAIATKLKTALGNYLLPRYPLLSNAMTSTTTSMAGAGFTGASTNWTWADAQYCTLLSEVQVHGSTVLSSSFYDVGTACYKLPVFNFINHVQYSRTDFWLRAVASSSRFCTAGASGRAGYDGAGISNAVRPLICIGA